MSLRRPIALTLALGALPVVCTTAPAHADFVKLAWIDGDNFVVQVTEIPDFDQVRASGGGAFGLPGSGGAHCVPTSATNMMAYAANHGFPQIAPGPADWQLQAKYTAAGLAILQMGQFMGTIPAGVTDAGTTPSGGMDGLESWLYAHPELTVSGYFASGNYAPLLEDMAQQVLGGGLVSFCYGRYQQVGTVFGVPLIERDGGHCITLTRAASAGSSKVVWARDPASPNDGDVQSQSDFANRTLVFENQWVAVSNSITGLRLMNAIEYSPAKIENAYLDGVYAVRPKAGYSFVYTPDSLLLKINWGALLAGYGGPDTKTFAWDLTATIFDAVLGPDGNHLYVASPPVGAGAATVHSLALADGSVEPVFALPGVQRLEFGRDRSLYAWSPGGLTRIDLAPETPTAYTAPLPYAVDAIALDDSKDEALLLAVADRRLVTLPDHLDAPPDVTGFPPSIPSTVEPVVAVDPTDGRLWLVETQTAKLLAWDVDSGAVDSFVVPGLVAPTSVDIDDTGRLFVVDQGKVVELVASESGYAPVEDSNWAGVEAGERFRVSRSRTNIDPVAMSGPAWRNLVPEELAGLTDGPSIVDCSNQASASGYGQGKAGLSGTVPQLTSSGLPILGAEATVALDGALPGTTAYLLAGTQPLALPFDEGTLLVLPDLILPLLVDAGGSATFEAPLGPDPELCGGTLFLQAMYREPGSAGPLETVQTAGLQLRIGS